MRCVDVVASGDAAGFAHRYKAVKAKFVELIDSHGAALIDVATEHRNRYRQLSAPLVRPNAQGSGA